MAVVDEDGPYAVPLSYVYHENLVYFHCAKTGHKLDAINFSKKVSFCVIDQDQVVPEKFTTLFRSVMVFGEASILHDENEKREALQILGKKYTPYDEQGLQKEIAKQKNRLCDKKI